MKKNIIFLGFLSCFYLVNLQSMENQGKTEIWDDGEVIIHEGDGFFSDDELGKKKTSINRQEISTGVFITQNEQAVEHVKKQSWFKNLAQKIKKYGDLIFTQEGFVVLISGVVVGYSIAIKCGYDPLNIYPCLEKVIDDYDKIGTR